MALREPAPGLRLRHNANSPKRVEVIVPAGAELEVPAEVAAQLQAADPHFRPIDDGPLTPRASKVRRPGKTTEGD